MTSEETSFYLNPRTEQQHAARWSLSEGVHLRDDTLDIPLTMGQDSCCSCLQPHTILLSPAGVWVIGDKEAFYNCLAIARRTESSVSY